nr:hypothetical protein [Tanacetum cinerariifolium]
MRWVRLTSICVIDWIRWVCLPRIVFIEADGYAYPSLCGPAVIKVYDLVSCAMNGINTSRVSASDEDPYEAIRHAYLVGTDTESERFEGEDRTPESPHIVAPPTCHVEESEGFGTSGARSTSSESTEPLLPDHPLTHTTPVLVLILCRSAHMAVCVPPVMSPGLSTDIAEVAAMSDSAFPKRFRSSCDSSPSLTLPVQKRYIGTSMFILGTNYEEDDEVEESLDFDSESEDIEDEGPTVEDEDPTVRDKGLAAEVEGPIVDDESYGLDGESYGLGTTVSEPLGLGYGALKRRELALEEDHVYSTFQPILTIGNKMYKAFPLAEQFPTANEDKLPLLTQRDATAEELYLAAEVKDATITLSNKVEDPISGNIKWYQSLVIKFGDSYEALKDDVATGSTTKGTGKKKGRTVALTTEDMQKRKNDVKARTTLLLALPDEHQLRFSKYKTAQELWAAILKTFGGNEATKKTKKNLLKQQYGNFKAEGSKTMEQTFNKLQAMVSHLEFMDIEIEQDDLNQKFLTSLPLEWLMHTIVWRNKSDIDTITKNSSRNEEVNTASILIASTYVSPASANIRATSISQDTACAYIASQSNGKKISIQGTDVAGFDKSKVECFNCHKMGYFARECMAPRNQDKGRRDNYRQGSKVEKQAPKDLMAINGVGCAECEVFDNSLCSKTCKKNTDSLNSKITELTNKLSDIENMLYHYKLGLSQVEARLAEFKNQEVKYNEKIRGLEFKVESRANRIESLTNKIELLKKEKEGLDIKLIGFQTASKDLDSLLERLPKFADDTITDYGRPLPTIESTSNDLQNKNPSVIEIGASPSNIVSKPFIKFVKETDSPTENKADKVETVRKTTVKYAELYRKLQRSLMLRDMCLLVKEDARLLAKEQSKPNSVLFTDLEFIVLGRDFRLIDDTNVLLRTPRQHNMYSIDLNNIVSHKDLTCLVVKASVDECMLWHRRLGKQHRASYKTKLVNSVTKPLHTLHMDLFGPTSDETSGIIRNFITEIENLKELRVKIIRCDNRAEFRNKEMNDFCSKKGIKREFNNARTPQQNGVTERRNRTLIKAARTMLTDAKLPVTFWAEAVNTAYNLGKFEEKGDKSYFIGYSMSSKSFRVFNKRTKKVEQNLHVDFLENKPIEKGAGPNWLFDIDSLTNSMNYVPVVVADACNADAPKSSGNFNPTATSTNPPANHMETLAVETPIPTVSSPVPTACLNDSLEPSSDTRLISKRVTNQDDTPSLDNILTLTNRFEDILRVTTNTDDTNGVEADLGNMETTITASPTPTLRIHKTIQKDLEFLARVYKVEKAMYRLHQAPRAWYGTLSKYLLTNGFQRGTIDQTLFIRRQKGDFILVQVCVEDIIFGSSNLQLYREFEALMREKFQMSAMGELNFFLDVRSTNTPMDKENPLGKDGTRKDVDLHLYRSMIGSLMYLTASRPDNMFVVCASARHQVTPKECHLHAVKRIFRYLKGHPKLGLWYPKESPFDLVAYLDSDYDGATQDRKSTTRGCQFLGRRLISWKCKKQTIVATSTIEAEYVAAASGRGQVLWIQNQLLDNGKVPVLSSFCDYHNMIAILEKYEHNQDFHQIVDFVEASHIRYALTFNPTVYVSHIRQFWSTARIEKTEEGTKILATIDGKLIIVSESSIRRNLKLNDEAGISSLPDAKLFENLTLMGYNISPNQKFTFQKGQFSHQWKYLIHTIMQCLSPKSTGFNEFSSNIATALVCLITNKAQQTSPTTHSSPSLLPVPTEPLPTVTPSGTPHLRQYTRRARIAQSSALPTAADESASSIGDGSQGEACHTVTGLVAGQDRENTTKTSTLPSDSTPRVTSLAADKGSMQHQIQELTALCTSLQRQHTEMASKIEAQELEIKNLKAKVKLLEDKEGGGITQSGVDAPIKGRSLDEGEEAAKKALMTQQRCGSIPTTGPPATCIPTINGMVPTTSLIFTTATESTPYTRRKGNKKMVESDTPKKKKLQEQIDVQVARELEDEMASDVQRMNEQIVRDAEIARIQAEEELQMMIDGLDRNNETVNNSQILNSAKKTSLQEATERFLYVSIEESCRLESKALQRDDTREIKEKFNLVWKQMQVFIPMGSKEEGERFKRKGLTLEQESANKVKITEEHLDREDLNQLLALVKETLNIKTVVNDKENELWVELKKLYEPDVEDQLWTHTQSMMHALIEWKLYDTCGVHHVTSKDQEMFMLVEKDYPFRKGEDCWEENAQGIPIASEEFLLAEQFPTANEDKLPLLTQSDAITEELCAATKVKDATITLSNNVEDPISRNITYHMDRPKGRHVLALKAWAGCVDTQMIDMLWAWYDDHRLVYDMLLQQTALQQELQEMKDRVTMLEQERDRKER